MKPREVLIAVAVVALVAGWAAPAAAADFKTGMEAYTKGDYATALREWQPLAEEGSVQAQYGMGVLYENGHGVALDEKQAFDWYLRAAEQGDANAQFTVAGFYGRREVVQAYPIVGIRWYQRAADQGHTASHVVLAMSFREGRDVPASRVAAYEWARRAREGAEGDIVSQIDRLVDELKAGMTAEQIETAEGWLATTLEGETVEPPRKLSGAWVLRTSQYPADHPSGAKNFNEFVVAFDDADDGVLQGRIQMPDGSVKELQKLKVDGRDVSFRFLGTQATGRISNDGAAVSGTVVAEGFDWLLEMRRMNGGAR